MSVVSVNEIKTGRTGSITATNERQYQRQFRVICSSASDDQFTVMSGVSSSTSITLGTPFPSDQFALCDGFSCKPDGADDVQWIVTVSYSSSYDSNDALPPTQRPVQRQWSFTSKQKVLDYDINDEPILNSADDFPEQAFERTEYPALLSVNVNVADADFDASLFWSYAGKCNSGNFKGADAGQVMFIPSQAVEQQDNENGNYWQVSYSFLFDPDGHDVKRYLDQGFNKLDGGNKVKILDDDDEPVQDARLLDGSGGELADGATPVFLEAEIIEKLDFSIFQV